MRRARSSLALWGPLAWALAACAASSPRDPFPIGGSERTLLKEDDADADLPAERAADAPPGRPATRDVAGLGVLPPIRDLPPVQALPPIRDLARLPDLPPASVSGEAWVDDGAFRVTLVGSPMTLTLAHEAGRAAPPWLRRLATDAPQLADRLGAAELARRRHPLTPCGREVLRVDVRLVDVARLNDARALRSRSVQVGLFERQDAYAVVWVGWQSERESLLTAVHELAHLVHATRCDRRGGALSGSEAFAERVEEAATRAW